MIKMERSGETLAQDNPKDTKVKSKMIISTTTINGNSLLKISIIYNSNKLMINSISSIFYRNQFERSYYT